MNYEARTQIRVSDTTHTLIIIREKQEKISPEI